MKSILLATLVATCSLSTAQAQVRPGIKAGMGLTRYSGQMNTPDVVNMVGFTGGVTLNASVTSDGFFAIQPELLYSQKGIKLTNDAMVQRLHYIDVPMLARVNANGFIFEGGPQFGYLFKQKQTVDKLQTTPPYNPADPTEDTSLKGYNRIDVGYVAGIGYQLASGPSVGVRYNGGLRNISTKESGNTEAHNSAFQFFAEYTFGQK